MDEKKFARDELIGLNVKITKCTDPKWEGKKGLVLDETKNTFLLEIKGKQKRIAKKCATFEFTYDDKKICLKGADIVYRPEDRIKKVR
jgi:ribonuclease P protein subunit POP4